MAGAPPARSDTAMAVTLTLFLTNFLTPHGLFNFLTGTALLGRRAPWQAPNRGWVRIAPQLSITSHIYAVAKLYLAYILGFSRI
jgi:hypothetical protein